MAYWLLKTEPSDYSFADLARAGRARWDGVRNALAQKHLRTMNPGDLVFVYHTGKEKAVVGIARVASTAYPDPKSNAQGNGLQVIDLEADRPLTRPVTLAEARADAADEPAPYEKFALLRLPRLSVMPVPARAWKRILQLAAN